MRKNLPLAATGARTVLVDYMAAVNAIAKCITLDEAKQWSDKADALAAWAKIYRNPQAGKEARRLKLRAFRRMNELAEEIQPRQYLKGPGTKGHAQAPGPRALLRAQGLPEFAAQQVRRIGQIPKRRFEQLLASPDPPGLIRASLLGRGIAGPSRTSSAWREIVDGRSTAATSLSRFVRNFCQHHEAGRLAQRLWPTEARAARALASQAAAWLAEFTRQLPRDTKRKRPQ